MAYVFADLFKAQRDGLVILKYPEHMPDEFKLEKRFLYESVDYRNFSGENGLPFTLLNEILLTNKDAIKLVRKNKGDYEHTLLCLKKVNEYEEQIAGDDLFLETFRSYYGSKQCVYGVMKNT